jgi:hypothetical protein
VEIRWIISVAASCYYATGQILRGRVLVDAPLAKRLAEPVEEFEKACQPWAVDPIALVDQLTALAIEPTECNQQAQRAIAKLCGTALVDRMATAVTHWMRQSQRLFLEVHPQALAELELRAVPLREQWEARGPGLLAQLKRQLGSEVLVDAADVILVQPVLGGGGVSHVAMNRISFEAVLANPVAELPEITRLGWLLAQLHLDLPLVQGQMTASRALEVGAAALVPAILAAAQEVELIGSAEKLLPRALELWRLDGISAETLQAWWETYSTNRLPWGTAVAALHHLLADSGE